ncbi:MAG: DUF1330 domain-containing protein [Marinilabiliales bacterium]|nr:DUF1330 domain-containing protein [Marinilabiliales bacterium]
MRYYFIATISIHDPEGYQQYLDRADDVFGRYHGKYLAVDPQPILVEGEGTPTRTVLIEFLDKSDFETWYHSSDYQEILRFRLQSAHCHSILVAGK